MTMKNNSKPQRPQIKNLEELRLAKKRIKAEMKLAEKQQENSVVNKAVSFISNLKADESIASSKIESSLQWLGNKASEKYPMKGFSKIIISGLIMLAVPIITSKVQDYIKEKF